VNRTAAQPYRVLIADDDAGIRWALTAVLRKEGFEPLAAEHGQAALRMVREGLADVLLLDLVMPGMNGLEVLRAVRQLNASLPVILVTGHGSEDVAIEAGEHAADGILTKPFKNDDVTLAVRMALAGRPRTQNGAKRASPLDEFLLKEVMGPSAAMQSVVARIERVASSDFTMIIHGETGVGKELVAQAVHRLSRRSSGPFVAVDCGAIPATLIESELFGHEKGAFTGADHARVGCFEAAMGGTLFFDEIGNLPLAMQAKLLRALQERVIHHIGSTTAVELDVRVVAATNEDLASLVEKGEFRRDLYYRLNELSTTIPPLRQRPEDVIFLAKRFLDWTCKELHRSPIAMTESAVEALVTHSWPGNVRELRNVVRRAVLLAETTITEEHLQLEEIVETREEAEVCVPLAPPLSGPPLSAAAQSADEATFKEMVHDITCSAERTILEQYLKKTHGNLKRAAIMLHMDYKTLRIKAKHYKLFPLEWSRSGTDG
jgi:DNA-binding NtrC family response regulator